MTSSQIRPAARVVLLDEQGRVLLIEIDDPTVVNLADPSPGPRWVTPGGGVDAGERHEDAARRVLWEETGIKAAIGPWMWSAEARLATPRGMWLLPTRFYLARAVSPTVTLDHLVDDAERAAYRGHRWWTVADIRVSPDHFVPGGLADLLAPLVAGELPTTPILLP